MKNLCLKWRKMMVGHTPVIAVRKQDPDYIKCGVITQAKRCIIKNRLLNEVKSCKKKKNVFSVHFQNVCFALYILISHNTILKNDQIFGSLNFLGLDIYFCRSCVNFVRCSSMRFTACLVCFKNSPSSLFLCVPGLFSV